MRQRWMTGVGSRATPAEILQEMRSASRIVTQAGYGLRTGEASGADTAFDLGAGVTALKQVYLAKENSRDHPSPLYLDSFVNRYEAWDLVKRYHPYWQNLRTEIVRRLITRNVYQVLGPNLDDPSDFLLCWTEKGKLKGGTAWTIILAQQYDVPIYNYGNPADLPRIKTLLEQFA